MREFQEVLRCVSELFTVPSDCLPAEFRDKRSGFRTLASLDKLANKREKVSPHKLAKAAKSANLERYAKLAETESELVGGNRNQARLDRNEQTFYNLLSEIGWFADDDTDE